MSTSSNLGLKLRQVQHLADVIVCIGMESGDAKLGPSLMKLRAKRAARDGGLGRATNVVCNENVVAEGVKYLADNR